jgi:ribosomal-protein-alanine N-acetyltransferase
MARTAALLTARLRQRPYREDDLDRLWRLWTDPDVRRYLWDDQVIPRDTAAATMRDSMTSTAAHGFGHWAVTWRDGEDALIGFCGLRRREEAPGEVELIYGLEPALWGCGLIAEAARAWLRFGFETLGRTRIWALTDAPNARSEAVMRRLGMRFEQRLLHNGLDSVRYVIDRDEFVVAAEPYEVLA